MKKQQRKHQALLEQEFEELEEIECLEHEKRLRESGLQLEQEPPVKGDNGAQQQPTGQDGDIALDASTVTSNAEAVSSSGLLPSGKFVTPVVGIGIFTHVSPSILVLIVRRCMIH